MKIKHTLTVIVATASMLFAINSLALTIKLSNSLPPAFVCHFKAQYILSSLGGWSHKLHAGDTYKKDGEISKIVVSCFDNNKQDHINPTGHQCTYYPNLFTPANNYVVSRSGSNVLFNGKPLPQLTIYAC